MSVVVLGMHRSGTSAVTRVINLLGVPMCRPEHLLRGHAGNVRGHWECAPLIQYNEELLAALSARWWCPPEPAWVAALTEDKPRCVRARELFRTAHPTPHWVWKDPRASVLMEFWRPLLPTPPVVVVVGRHPMDVAASMHIRDHIGTEFSLALWEWYLRAAVTGSVGLPLLVADYAGLLADPIGWSRRVAQFLSGHGVPAALPLDPAGLLAYLEAGSDHRHAASGDEDKLGDSQHALWAWLQEGAVRSPSAALDPLPPAPTGLGELMDEVRDAFTLRDPTITAAGSTFVSGHGVRVLDLATTPTPARRARVSVLLFPNGGTATGTDAAALRPYLPTDAEIITATAGGDVSADKTTTGDGLLVVRRDAAASLATRLNAAAEVAAGSIIIVLAGPPVRPRRGWLAALRQTLDLPDCAVAAPAIYEPGGTQPVHGLQPTELFGGSEWTLADPGGEGRLAGTVAPTRGVPIPSASIAAFAISRRAFTAVGGFDPGLTGEGGEDVDLCVRLWRAGWRCLAALDAAVEMTFTTLPADPDGLLFNTLRLGLVHLEGRRLTEHLTSLTTVPHFADVLSRLTADGIGRRRREVDALSWYATDDLPEALGVELVTPGCRQEQAPAAAGGEAG